MEYNDKLTVLKGIGKKNNQLFHQINVDTVGDLLVYFPKGYEIFKEPVAICEAEKNEICSVKAIVIGKILTKKVRNLNITTVVIKDATGQMNLTFFNMPFIGKTLQPGQYYIFRGQVQEKGNLRFMEQPKVFKQEDYDKKLFKMQPVYSLTKGLTNNIITSAVKQLLPHEELLREFLPEHIRKCYQLMDYEKALQTIHFPEQSQELEEAKKRLIFNEFFLFILVIQKLKGKNEEIPNTNPMVETAETKRLMEALPYKLTQAQRGVFREIELDLTKDVVMNRLIQGDVGSGKTIVALMALLMCCANGYQGALMAPTEVLAKQHFDGISEMIYQYQLPLKPILLTGSMSAKDKKEAYSRIESGQANLIIGTHALIQEKVIYKNIALVVTDEQHRFGVRQREALAGKGDNVHVLVMSATPIPRTLAIILYGDLHISVINELPSNRLPIKSCVVNTQYRKTAYSFIKKEVEQGHQVYVICPMVEEGELENVENVLDYTDKLRQELPESIQIDYLHGKMKPNEKNRIMEAFGNHNIDVLVSTTVIEVGINVPNATVIVIENAQRFGLAQLHQLRGRVGRGKEQSYCIFISSNDSKKTMERLEILAKSNDGFFIANEDLKLRGPGDLFGVRQSGILDFKIGDIYSNADILKQASDCARELLEEDYLLQRPENRYLSDFLKMDHIQNIDFRTI